MGMDMSVSEALAEGARKWEEKLSRHGIRMHGYLLLSGKDILLERYWEPYGVGTLHRMYSVTKSFVALAVGLLVREGKLGLSDRICGYFPELLPEGGAHPWCGQMTVEDLLTMRTCYASTTYKRYDAGKWVESFFRVKPDHIPGTVFSYDTSASHTLAALVEKLTGMELLDYLRDRALRRLGFGEEAYILKDPQGVSQGGSGLMCTLRDMAAAAYLCLHYGTVETGGVREELIPRDYMERAVSAVVPTDLQPFRDEQDGYGYQFWRTREPGFVMYGMGGQLAMCFPKLDACFLTMADTIGLPAGLTVIYDGFYENIYPVIPSPERRSVSDDSGERGASGGPVPEKDGDGAVRMTGTAESEEDYRFFENAMGLWTLRLDRRGRLLELGTKDGSWRLRYGEQEWVRQKLPGTDYTCECKAEWKLGHLILKCHVTDEEQGHIAMDLAWKEDALSVRIENTGEPHFMGLKGFASAERIV